MSKKTTNPIEDDFSQSVRDSFDGWIQRVEKGRGMNDGFADLVALLPQGLMPIELKIGSVIDNILWSDEVRPSQISWHHKLANEGGTSMFLVGVWSGDRWRAYAFDGSLARHWDLTGFEVGQTCFEIDMNNLYQSLSDFVFEQLEN